MKYDMAPNGLPLPAGSESAPPLVPSPPAALAAVPPFPRLPGETPRAFSAFVAFFQLGHARSLPALADQLGEGLGTVKNWSSKFDWSGRLQAFNSGLLQAQAQAQAADWHRRLNQFREQEWDAAQKLITAAQCFLETFGEAEVRQMTLSQVSRALKISSAIARSALLGADLPASAGENMSPLQQQLLAGVSRVYGQPAPSSPPSHPSSQPQQSTINNQPMTDFMFNPDQYAQDGLQAGCQPDQMNNLIRAGILLQPRQLAASAAARRCDQPDGPTAIGYGGARGGGKSHWLLAQMGADDCQRVPGLNCLLLRKVGKANTENFENLRQRVFPALQHSYNASRGILTFENGSRIIIRHYQHEKDIDAFLGIEYDVIGIEEATTLTQRKYHDIRTCLRTSKPGWRPRLYSTTNPGGVGHDWYHKTFILPYEHGSESATRFIPARVEDNKFINPEYKSILDECTGWQREAWRDGNWNIASGQFFNTFRHDVHVIKDFDPHRITEWVAGMDYGFTHYTVVLLAGRDADDNLFIVDEHAERNWIPQRHALAIKAMCQRHHLFVGVPGSPAYKFFKPNDSNRLRQISAGGDLFSAQFDGSTIAKHFAALGLRIKPANTNRVQGWAEIQQRLGDPANGIQPTLFIHERCRHLLNCLPFLQHDPDHPADVLKTNVNEEGLGGDDAADSLRYLVATRISRCAVVKLRGF